jgi:hypothetical protein
VRARGAGARAVARERAVRARSFEDEARARLASLPAGALERAQLEWAANATLSEVVARSVLVRLSKLPLEKRRALASGDLARLRSCFDDAELPAAVVAQASAALAAFGDRADRARLFASLADAPPRTRESARLALESLEGAGSGMQLVDEISAELTSARGCPALAVAATWMRTGAESLPPEERAHCAAEFATIASRRALTSDARAQALGALRALDPARAGTFAREWLADPRADEALVRGACASVRAGHVDASTTVALLADPALGAQRRIDVAEAFFAARDADPKLYEQACAAVRALTDPGNDPELRARACAVLGSAGRAEDLERCEQWAKDDPDASVRAAASRALRHAEQKIVLCAGPGDRREGPIVPPH